VGFLLLVGSKLGLELGLRVLVIGFFVGVNDVGLTLGLKLGLKELVIGFFVGANDVGLLLGSKLGFDVKGL